MGEGHTSCLVVTHFGDLSVFQPLVQSMKWGLGILLLATIACGEGVLVSTPSGQIQGFMSTVNGRTVTEFLGIPYAKPPIRDLRFRRPVPYGVFSGTFVADKLGPACPQPTKPLAIVDPEGPMSEDCLTLNVVVPEGGELSKSVMIFIHGGAYLAGSSSNVPGRVLTTHGDVILVSINYRLGPMGFLNAGDISAPGNQGLLDQRMAIQWVKDNIQSFGGNSNGVTVFGESAGGGSTSAQCLSPLNIGLFQRAIAQSGSVFTPWSFDYNHVAAYSDLISEHSCSGDNKAEEINCLRTLDWKTLVPAVSNVMIWKPSLDNYFFTESPLETRSHIIHGINTPPVEMFSSVDFMSGVNSQEGLLMSEAPAAVASAMENTTVEEGISEAVLKATLSLLIDGSQKEYIGDVAFRTYGAEACRNGKDRLRLFTEFAGDYFFLISHIDLMSLRTKLRCPGRSYSYLLDQKQNAVLVDLMRGAPSWLPTGSNHADDLPYIFGVPIDNDLNLLLKVVGEYSDGDRELSELMIALWTTFAKTGEPDPELWEDYRLSHGSLRISSTKGVGMQSRLMDCGRHRSMLNLMLSSYAMDTQTAKKQQATSDGSEVRPGKEEL